MDANKKVSERIVERRKQLMLFASVISDNCGIPYHRYTAIERADVKITVDDLYRIAPALDTTPAELCRDLNHTN